MLSVRYTGAAAWRGGDGLTMIIPNQLPPIVTAARSSALQALALQAGQVLNARVLGPAPNGATQVQIQGQLLNLVLPQPTRSGDTLRLEVQGSGTQLRLALQVASATQPAASSTTQAVSIQTPSAAVQTSASTASAPPAATAGAPTSNIAASAAPTTTPPNISPTAPPGAPATAPAAAPTGPQGPIQTATAPAASAPSAPGGSAPGTTQTAPLAPQVPPGSTTPAAPATNAASSAAPAGPPQPAVVAPLRVSAPYASAAPASGNPAAASASGAGASVPINPPAPLNAPLAPTAQTTPPNLPSTPQAALTQMVQTALPQQNSMASLTAALTNIAGKVILPEPVARAAQTILANQINLDGGKLDGTTLQKAVLGSGVFQEASLARPGTPLLAPQTDMKAAMLALRQTLTTWLGQQTPLVAPVSQLAPPLRGQFPRARALEIQPVDPAADADDIGRQLLERTESALSRVRLHQHASLPDPTTKGADWSADLPVVIAGQQTLLQLQIHRDERGSEQDASERGWQMRFAINVPGLGEVGAQISLRGSATGVMLWAEQAQTSEALAADINALRDDLVAAGLEPGAVIVRHGAPPTPPKQAASSGHLVDSRR